MLFADGAAVASNIDFTGYITALTGTITTAQVLTVLVFVKEFSRKTGLIRY